MFLRLNLYILNEIRKPIVFSFFIFASLWIVQLCIRILDLAISKGVDGNSLIKLIIYYLPDIIVTSVPMSVLMGIMLGLSRLNQDSEIIAMQAAGISPLRILKPILFAGCILSLFIMFLNEKLAPLGRFLSEQVIINEITLKKPLPKVAQNIFFDGGKHFKMYVRNYDPEQNLMKDITMFQFSVQGWPRMTEADSATIEEGNLWIFRNGRTFQFAKDGTTEYLIHFEKWTWPISERYTNPVTRNPNNKSPKEMNMQELLAQIRMDKAKGLSPLQYETQFWYRTAFPFSSFFMILIAVPLSVRPARNSSSSGFGMGLVILILYYVLLTTGKSLGGNGTLHPGIANWLPNLACLIFGLFFLKKASLS